MHSQKPAIQLFNNLLYAGDCTHCKEDVWGKDREDQEEYLVGIPNIRWTTHGTVARQAVMTLGVEQGWVEIRGRRTQLGEARGSEVQLHYVLLQVPGMKNLNI